MSALMKQKAIYVMNNKFTGLGGDGLAHQPVEHLATLRAIPNLYVMRPCDTIETAECWKLALEAKETPSVIALTDQEISNIRNSHDENLTAKGGYIISKHSGKQEVLTIVATGPEVTLALEVQKKLEEEGWPTSVVSMPCCELFD